MEYVLIVVAVIVVVAVVVWLRSRRSQQPATPRSAADPFSSADMDSVHGNPRTLKPGDIVVIRNEHYSVRGVLRLTEGSYSWSEVFLDTGVGDRMWLSVEDDPDLEVAIWRELRNVTVSPGPDRISLDGRAYTSDERGKARFESEGTTGLAATGTVRYHDYEAGDGTLLSFEDFSDGKWECARGELLRHSEYQIYAQGAE